MSGGRRRLLFEVSAPVQAPVDQLIALIDRDWLLDELGWTAADFSSGSLVRAPGSVVGQGGWWYRGEYTVETIGSEVRLVHRVFNVARQSTWVVALANRLFLGYREKLQRGVDDLARKADVELGS